MYIAKHMYIAHLLSTSSFCAIWLGYFKTLPLITYYFFLPIAESDGSEDGNVSILSQVEKTPPCGNITVSITETKKQTVKMLFGNKNVKQTDKLSNHMTLDEIRVGRELKSTGPCSRNVDIPIK